MEEKNKFMLKVIELSIKSAETIGGPFGCVIVKENKIISEGSNKVTSTNDPTAHGEIVAIREACLILNTFNLSGCELYSTCEPCPMCLSAIYWSHIDKIFYANTRDDAKNIDFDDSFIYSEIILLSFTTTLPKGPPVVFALLIDSSIAVSINLFFSSI